MKRIIIVDDDFKMIEVLETGLRANGYEIETATSGSQCLKIIERFDPDVIILDIMMPGMDGWTVLKELERRRICKKAKVFMLTARPLTEEELKRYEFQHLVHYLKKPVSIKKLLKEIQKVYCEEDRIEKETEKLSRSLGRAFAENYRKTQKEAALKRRIASSHLSPPSAPRSVENEVECIDYFTRTIECIEKELSELKEHLKQLREQKVTSGKPSQDDGLESDTVK